jgi:hypothetical protein
MREVQVWFRDEAGNVSTSYTDSIIYDSQVGTLTLLKSINSRVSEFSESTSVSTVVNALESLSNYLKVVATPTWGSLAENMKSQTGTITSSGKFNRTAFDSTNDLALSSGFSNSTLNNIPYLGFIGFADGQFYGSGVMLYRQYIADKNKELSDLFYLNQARSLYGYILNANDSDIEYTSQNTNTIFSDGHSPNFNGYHSPEKFSKDDGAWGFANDQALDGNGGPYHSAGNNGLYGVANENGRDTAAKTFYWNTAISTTNYIFYFFVVYE